MIKTPVKWRPYGELDVPLLEHSDGVYLGDADYDEVAKIVNTHSALVEALEKIANKTAVFNGECFYIATEALKLAKEG